MDTGSKNELLRLESIVLKDISTLVELNCTIDQELLIDFQEALEIETEQIKNSIIFNVVSVSRKAELKRYIQEHQQNIIKLASNLLQYTHPDKIVTEERSTEHSMICRYIYQSLEDLLSFVERHFTGYFNPDAWIPTSYRLIIAQELRLDLDGIESGLSGLGIDEKLMGITFYPFRQFLNQEISNDITYRKVKYLKTLQKELQHMLSFCKKQKDATTQLKHLLVKLNFNAPAFFSYCTSQILFEVDTIKMQSEKLEKLAFSLKEINQVVDKPGLTFDVRYSPLKEQIANWIVEELNFQERSPQLEIRFPQQEHSFSLETKIQLDLSVAQVACFVRGLVEGGIIKNKNLSELIRLLVSIIKTKRSEKISPDSFRMKYYNVEHSARMAVAARLRAIAEYLTKD